MSQIPSPYETRSHERRAIVNAIVLLDRLFYVTSPQMHGPLKETLVHLTLTLAQHVQEGTI